MLTALHPDGSPNVVAVRSNQGSVARSLRAQSALE